MAMEYHHRNGAGVNISSLIISLHVGYSGYLDAIQTAITVHHHGPSSSPSSLIAHSLTTTQNDLAMCDLLHRIIFPQMDVQPIRVVIHSRHISLTDNTVLLGKLFLRERLRG